MKYLFYLGVISPLKILEYFAIQGGKGGQLKIVSFINNPRTLPESSENLDRLRREASSEILHKLQKICSRIFP